MYEYEGEPESEEYGEEAEEEELNKTYMDLMWQYLHHMLIPGNTLMNFRQGFPSVVNYDQLMAMIRRTIDPYLRVYGLSNQSIIQEANQTAHKIRQDLRELGFDTFDPYSYNYLGSIPHSNLPILLLNALGLFPSLIQSGRSILLLYPNEWKALIDAGLDLCEQVHGHPYFYWLIADISKLYWYIHEAPEEEEELQDLPGYTADDLIDNLLSHKKCYAIDFDMQSIRDIYEKELRNHDEENYRIEWMTQQPHPNESIQRDIENRIRQAEERAKIGYAIYEAIIELEDARKNVDVRSRII